MHVFTYKIGLLDPARINREAVPIVTIDIIIFILVTIKITFALISYIIITVSIAFIIIIFYYYY